MICIKANDLPRQSIKLARASGEERKRNHQNLIVRDARSQPEDREARLSRSVYRCPTLQDQDQTSSNLTMLIIRIIKDNKPIFDG